MPPGTGTRLAARPAGPSRPGPDAARGYGRGEPSVKDVDRRMESESSTNKRYEIRGQNAR